MNERRSLAQLVDERRDNFNALRLLSAFAIIVSHYFPLRDGTDVNEPLYRLTGVCNIGKVVTYVCFVVSGMAVARAYVRDPRPGKFLLHRLARLLPGLWGSVVFCLAAGMLLTTMSPVAFLKSKETIQFAMNGVMYPNHYALPGVFTGFDDNRGAMNGSLWVIAPLFLMYLFALALGVGKLLRRPGLVLALAAVALVAWEIYEIHGIAEGSRWKKYEVWIDFVPHLSFFFLCGVAVASREKGSVNLWFAMIALAAAIICVAAHPQRWVTYTVITLAIVVITIRLSFVRWRWLRPVNAAGVIAYGVYLYSWPVQQLFVRVWTPNRSGIEQVGYACVACAILGTVSWFLIEAPAVRLAHRK